MNWLELLTALWLCACGGSAVTGALAAASVGAVAVERQRFVDACLRDAAEQYVAGQWNPDQGTLTYQFQAWHCQVEVEDDGVLAKIVATCAAQSETVWIPHS
jgi:hypothetical protein